MTENMVDIREIRQKEALESFGNQGILLAAPRFGKIKVSIDIMKNKNPKKVLICYPRVDIQSSWENDFKFWGYKPEQVVYSTFIGLAKHEDEKWDFVIFDEIHEASRKQLIKMKEYTKSVKNVLGLSGTMTNKTEREVLTYADLAPFYIYPIEKAVEEGILCDYQIFVHRVPLSTKIDGRYKRKSGKQVSEKTKFDDYMYVLNQSSKTSKKHMMLEKFVIHLLQQSSSKLQRTKELLELYKNERVLVFCGVTAIADKLGIPTYHSKSKEKEIFEDFCNGKGNSLVTIKMAQAGITIKPINLGIVNYTSGNPEDFAQKICRFLGMEYDRLDKKAELHVICADEIFEISRLKTATIFFDQNKIKWI